MKVVPRARVQPVRDDRHGIGRSAEPGDLRGANDVARHMNQPHRVGREDGSWGLAVALTLRGGQCYAPVGRRAGVAAAKTSTALGTVMGTDEALAANPAIPEGRIQLPCSPNGSDRPRRPISRTLRNPGRCYANDRLRTPAEIRYGRSRPH